MLVLIMNKNVQSCTQSINQLFHAIGLDIQSRQKVLKVAYDRIYDQRANSYERRHFLTVAF